MQILVEIIFWVVLELLWWFIEIPIFHTGEFFLYVLSFGRRKPRGFLNSLQNDETFEVLTSIEFLVGLLVWGLAGFFVWYFFVNA